MRALSALAFLLSTYYVAAMFRSLPLLTLCAAEVLTGLFLFLLPRYLGLRLRAAFARPLTEAVQGEAALCEIIVRNPSFLPTGRLELRLRSGEAGETAALRQVFQAGAEHGETRLPVQVRAPHCGLARLRLDRARIYDYLCLFSAGKRLHAETCLAVFPPEQVLRVPIEGVWGGEQPRQPVGMPGEAAGELRNIREYRPGDPVRRIHWNQSARMDRLWLKEFEQEADPRVHVLAEAGEVLSPEAADAFYTLLSALLLGLTAADAAVSVHWAVPEGGADQAEARDPGQVRAVLLRMYQTGLGTASLAADVSPETRYFRLTGGLSLFQEERLLCRFSRERLAEEMRAFSLKG